MGPDGRQLPVPEGLPNAHMRLYGGAQYHRAMAEFRSAVGAIACPDITCDPFNKRGIQQYSTAAALCLLRVTPSTISSCIKRLRTATGLPLCGRCRCKGCRTRQVLNLPHLVLEKQIGNACRGTMSTTTSTVKSILNI